MKRFLKVRGKHGHLVADPHAPNARRYVGQKAKEAKPDANHTDRFEPRDQVIEDHVAIRKAIVNNEVVYLDVGEGVTADHVKWSEKEEIK